MHGITWVCELAFSNVNFMKSNYRASILNENLASELRTTMYKTPNFEDLVLK